MSRSRTVVAALAVLLALGAFLTLRSNDGYQLRVMMASADGTFVGGKVLIGGKKVGTIAAIGVVDKKAVVTVAIDDETAPLHAGTNARISWESVVGGRVVELLPGDKSNPVLASGQTVMSTDERVELDDVLAMLDAPTRKNLQGLIGELNATLAGKEPQVNDTINSSGPAIQALGEIMRAVGDDGPAIKALVTKLRRVTKQVAARDGDVSATVDYLHTLTAALADRRSSLRETIDELPATVRTARKTLDAVPGAVDETVPLLKDLQPATAQLPETARNLSPVLQRLRPTVASLKPTLASAQALLQYTPELLDSADGTLPDVTTALTMLQPAVSFLRPYTPELTGWLTNWTSLFASQTSGNYARLLIPEGISSAVGVHQDLPVGVKRDDEPAPGSIANQPWVDANGDEVR